MLPLVNNYYDLVDILRLFMYYRAASRYPGQQETCQAYQKRCKHDIPDY